MSLSTVAGLLITDDVGGRIADVHRKAQEPLARIHLPTADMLFRVNINLESAKFLPLLNSNQSSGMPRSAAFWSNPNFAPADFNFASRHACRGIYSKLMNHLDPIAPTPPDGTRQQ